jgi:aromatic ring-opening dioxygenase LigB subunit
MGKIVGAFGTSHAFTFMEPAKWDTFRAKNRESLKRRRNIEPPEQPGVGAETLESNTARFEHVRAAHADIRRLLDETKPDTLVVIGDDQHEVFSATTMPQLAVYVGGDFRVSTRFGASKVGFTSHDALAQAILETGRARGFEVATLDTFENDELSSHAHAQLLEAFTPGGDIPVVLVFMNAIQHPAIDPADCYAFGKVIAEAIAGCAAAKRVAISASGGWSHFTAGYPWDNYKGPNSYGAISEDFDRDVADRIMQGKGDTLASLSGTDLLNHGNIELRAWIALLGAIGPARPKTLVYEPFYRAVMGMAAGTWKFDPA